MENSLKGKKILFFYTPFFSYEKDIIKELEEKGAEVWSFNERPSDNVFLRILIRLNKKIIETYIIDYYKKIMDSVADINFDYVFVLKAESYTPKVAALVKDRCPNSVFIRYFWDSVENYNDVGKVSNFFNYIYTFDPNDSIKYGYTFLPLFYTRSYENIADADVPQMYDLMFAGTVHSDRYTFISSITSQIKQMGGSCYSWFFLPSKILYYKMKVQDKKMRKAKITEFSFVPMSRSELMDCYLKSRIQVDIQHPKQTGLTMRTIETLGAKKKLITTNHLVQEYDFYRPENILIVDRENPVIDDEFLKSQWKEIPDDLYEKYSLRSWLNTIFKL